jgi:Fe-S-cluster containining protein
MRAFECKMCGDCCYGEGGIFVDEEETGRIAGFLGLSRESFVTGYCETRNGRLYITTGPDRFCVFHDWEKQCLIHPVNPRACALWPFYPAILKDRGNWKEAGEACPGINPECPFEEFVRQGKKSI